MSVCDVCNKIIKIYIRKLSETMHSIGVSEDNINSYQMLQLDHRTVKGITLLHQMFYCEAPEFLQKT